MGGRKTARKKAVVLSSGGLDSTTAMAIAKAAVSLEKRAPGKQEFLIRRHILSEIYVGWMDRRGGPCRRRVDSVHTFHWMSSLDSEFSSMLINLMFSTRSAMRKITRTASKRTLLDMTVRRKVKGATIRSARIPTKLEALNPAMINERANSTANKIDRPYRNFTILGPTN
jgi:hypothetical protein